mmetsp:Transcript_34790/g.77358  ORF Transcript_34790/g.77358 Transcript_34790/m.77358 type:complete len:473 (+) Transcript_34790:167-1585(+)
MVIISKAMGLPLQLANVFFFLSTFWADLLVLKFFLVIAFALLLINAAMGFPAMHHYASTGYISIDGIIWAVLCGGLHFIAMVKLVMDELPVKFQGENDEALWRFFLRRSGMGRLEFKEVLKRGEWVRVKKGERIVSHTEAYEYLYLLVEGRPSCYLAPRAEGQDHNTSDTLKLPLLSGAMFHFALCSVFGIPMGFEKISGVHIEVWSEESNCLLYRWHIKELNHMAVHGWPALCSFWQNMVLQNVSTALERMDRHDKLMAGEAVPPFRCSTGAHEQLTYEEGGRSLDFTAPLENAERPSGFLGNLMRALWLTINPFPPPGMRHTAQPYAGVLARNRLLAMSSAGQAQALAAREASFDRDLVNSSAALSGLQITGSANPKLQPTQSAKQGSSILLHQSSIRTKAAAGSKGGAAGVLVHVPSAPDSAGREELGMSAVVVQVGVADSATPASEAPASAMNSHAAINVMQDHPSLV